MHRGGLGLGTLFTLWILLLWYLETHLTMLSFYWLNLGSLNLILTITCIPFANVDSSFSKITISCLVTSASSTLMDIMMP
jgi:hypothetical protein